MFFSSLPLSPSPGIPRLHCVLKIPYSDVSLMSHSQACFCSNKIKIKLISSNVLWLLDFFKNSVGYLTIKSFFFPKGSDNGHFLLVKKEILGRYFGGSSMRVSWGLAASVQRRHVQITVLCSVNAWSIKMSDPRADIKIKAVWKFYQLAKNRKKCNLLEDGLSLVDDKGWKKSGPMLAM